MSWFAPKRRLHPEDRGLLTLIHQNTVNILLKETKVRAEIQALVAVVGPLVTAVQALETQTAAELQTIQDLKAKLDAGGTLAPDEVQALADAASTLQSLTAGAIAAVPAVQPAVDAASTAAAAPQPGS